MVAHWFKLGKGANVPLIIFPPKNNLLATEMEGKNKLGARLRERVVCILRTG
jgi:hypothetical protein